MLVRAIACDLINFYESTDYCVVNHKLIYANWPRDATARTPFIPYLRIKVYTRGFSRLGTSGYSYATVVERRCQRWAKRAEKWASLAVVTRHLLRSGVFAHRQCGYWLILTEQLRVTF